MGDSFDEIFHLSPPLDPSVTTLLHEEEALDLGSASLFDDKDSNSPLSPPLDPVVTSGFTLSRLEDDEEEEKEEEEEEKEEEEKEEGDAFDDEEEDRTVEANSVDFTPFSVFAQTPDCPPDQLNMHELSF